MIDQQPMTIERLERALALAAYMVELDGAVAAPLFERLERDLAALRRQEDAVARAMHLLETYVGTAERRAIAPPAA